MIEEKTDRPVIGVIPYLGDLGLHEEDAIPVERLRSRLFDQPPSLAGSLKVVVLRLRYISNFTDFDPFLFEPGVELTYSLWDREIENADLIFIPGSKNTVKDLLFLREHGIEKSISRAVERGTPLIGVCGGYQMLGKTIYDPYGVETEQREIAGLGFLDTETFFEKTKVTSQVEAYPSGIRDIGLGISGDKVRGYEIHMGRTTGDIGLFKIKRSSPDSGGEDLGLLPEGSRKGNVWGTYIHGLFDDDDLRRRLLDSLRLRKGLAPPKGVIGYAEWKEKAMNEWAKTLKEALDIDFILKLVGTRRRNWRT
jgi:adenosylcobyric acid synthase